jgi:hypothetical protein
MQREKKQLNIKVFLIFININLENVSEAERNKILSERVSLDNEIKNYNVKCEQIREEELARKKKHQDDLKYQMLEKERLQQKEQQAKIYEERAAKLWEMEYSKKINEQKEMHLRKVIYYRNLFYHTFSCKKLKEEKEFDLIFINI